MEQGLTLKHSEHINEIASALAKAQGEMKPAVFNRVNPHFKSRYADFTSCMDACRLPLSKNGLAVSQLPTFAGDGKFVLNTLLLHASGQWMACEFPLHSKTPDNIQALGSVMSYAKRYSLCGMLGIVADEDIDDDGEASLGRQVDQSDLRRIQPTPPPRPVQKIGNSQVAIIKKMEEKLDDECKKKLYDWMKSAYKIDAVEDIIVENFTKVASAFENAVKYMESNKVELANA